MLSMMFKAGLDATAVERGAAMAASKAGAAFSSMGKEISNRLAGTFTVAALMDRVVSFGQSIIEAADNVGDLSDNLELSVEEVQKLGIAAQLAGTRFGRIERVLRTIQALRDQALAGDEKAQKTFSTLGVNPAGKSPLEIIREMLAASDKVKGASGLVADTFKANLTTVKNVMEKLDNIGPVDIFTQDQIDKIGQAKDSFEELARVLKVVFAPGLIFVLDSLSNAILGLKGTIEGLYKVGGLMISGGAGDSKGILDKLKVSAANFFTSGLAGTIAPASMSMVPKAESRDTSKDKPPIPTMDAPKAAPMPLALQSDALSRIGLFVGGRGDASNQLVTIGNYQLSELRAIRAELQHGNR